MNSTAKMGSVCKIDVEGGLTIRRRLTACPTDLADSVRFAKSLAVGTTGDAEVSTKRLIRSRLRYGQSGRATRRRYLAGGKQRIRPPNLVTQRHLHKSAALRSGLLRCAAAIGYSR